MNEKLNPTVVKDIETALANAGVSETGEILPLSAPQQSSEKPNLLIPKMHRRRFLHLGLGIVAGIVGISGCQIIDSDIFRRQISVSSPEEVKRIIPELNRLNDLLKQSLQPKFYDSSEMTYQNLIKYKTYQMNELLRRITFYEMTLEHKPQNQLKGQDQYTRISLKTTGQSEFEKKI